MIKQFLERDFMLSSAKTLAKTTEEMQARTDDSEVIKKLMETAEVEETDLQEAKRELLKAITREEVRAPDKEDSVSFFPRDVIMSLTQSALQQYCETRKAQSIVEKTAEIKAAAPHGEIPVTDKELAPQLADFLSNDAPSKLFSDFELADIGWANCLLAIGVRNWRKPRAFNSTPAAPYKIGDRARVILVSDWGSGLPRAQKVAEAIRKELDDPAAADRDKHLIHLGDVYYSGWAAEYEKNFLGYWPVKAGEVDTVTSWSLNANHDMYSGGDGYFNCLLGDDRFKHQEKSSFFSLENDKWIVLGLDTGYSDNRVFDAHDLYGAQDQWAYDKLANAKGKKGIILSHHQPFSAYEKGGDKLLAKLRRPLDDDLVLAWFWGHEHRCALYEEREKIKYPRLIGHGGIPFYKEAGTLPTGVLYEYKDGFDDLFETWNYFGFVVLDFDAQQITARYINERGQEHRRETII
jgi:hypothetical protein